MNIFYTPALILFLLLLVSCEEEAKNNNIACESSTELKTNMLHFVNQARAHERFCGDFFYAPAPPLSWHYQLTQAAQIHTTDMAENNFFSHTGSNNSSPSSRVENAGYFWVYQGENLAAAVESSEEAVSRLLNSPEHCKNIMNPVYLHVGAACSKNNDSDHILYWAQEFGTR